MENDQQTCPYCGTHKLGLADHIRAKHPEMLPTFLIGREQVAEQKNNDLATSELIKAREALSEAKKEEHSAMIASRSGLEGDRRTYEEAQREVQILTVEYHSAFDEKQKGEAGPLTTQIAKENDRLPTQTVQVAPTDNAAKLIFERFLEAATKGDAVAQYNLGHFYYIGKGITANKEEAVSWWRRSAEQGDRWAQCRLAECYENGDGIPVNKSEALKLYRTAAKKGFQDAQYHLGRFYLNGIVVDLNHNEAKKWFTAAAEQGHIAAKDMLRKLHENVGKDKSEPSPSGEPSIATASQSTIQMQDYNQIQNHTQVASESALEAKDSKINEKLEKLKQQLKDANKKLIKTRKKLRIANLNNKYYQFDLQLLKKDHEREASRLKSSLAECTKELEKAKQRVKRQETKITLLKNQKEQIVLAEESNSSTRLWGKIFLENLPNNNELLLEIFGKQVITYGDDPFEVETLDIFFENCNIAVAPIKSGVEVLIVGRSGWIEEELDEHIALRENKSIKVYSQEMVVATLALGGDPYEIGNRDLLLELGKGHPALEYLMESGFDWPRGIYFRGSGSSINGDHWLEEGILKYLGYQVGFNGLSEENRRQILEKALAATLKPDKSGDYEPEYLRQWGAPNSKKRLRKIAYSIATFARLKKGMPNADSYSMAIDEWEADLKWLKDTYYRSSMSFRWPSTKV